MLKSILKRGMVTVFVFLIISSFASNLCGKYNKLEPRESIRSEDDYVLANWKFNEGNGEIAHDSSGHGYDGAIDGASWAQGFSSFSLDFDGTNDYVSIDSYAKDRLGINKTDDLILSLYFKTSQTTQGIMYGMSHANYNPGIHIAINPNGTLQFRVWYLSCGFIVTTEGVYNDNEWHFVEVYYNGVSANPITTIYVDDELDTIFEHYVCGFTADQFDKAKIGTRSNDSKNNFDGRIDEIRIVKYAGGNKQGLPEINGPNNGTQNKEYNFSFIIIDPEEDDIWLYVDWGDGDIVDWIGPYESGEEVILSHSWEEGGLYHIKSKSMDIWDDGPPSYHDMHIGNQVPNAPTISGPFSGEIDEIIQYTFITEDYEGNDIELYVDWGDGQVEDWIGPFSSGEEVKINHIWTSKNIYEITAKAKDGMGEGEWSEPHMVIIGNDPPDTPKISGENTGEVGVEYEYTIVTTDPDGDNLLYDIQWGDGTNLSNFGPYASGAELKLSHKWNKQGIYVIKVRACDVLGKCSNWVELEVSMPKNYLINYKFGAFGWLFNQLINTLLAINHIIQLYSTL